MKFDEALASRIQHRFGIVGIFVGAAVAVLTGSTFWIIVPFSLIFGYVGGVAVGLAVTYLIGVAKRHRS